MTETEIMAFVLGVVVGVLGTLSFKLYSGDDEDDENDGK